MSVARRFLGDIVKNGAALPPAHPSALVRLSNLALGYNRRPAIDHLNGAFMAGSLTAVIGPNGAGKSTLLKGLVGALKPLEGDIRIAGLDRREIAYLPQQHELDPAFPICVLDVLCLGLWGEIGLFRAVGRLRLARAEAALLTVGLDGFAQRAIGSLSGGQLQRVLFARLLLQEARLILLDEPFTAIDARTIADLLQLILRWHQEERTVIAALHDLALVRQHFPQTLLLCHQPITWGPTADVVTAANLARARDLGHCRDNAADCGRRAFR